MYKIFQNLFGQVMKTQKKFKRGENMSGGPCEKMLQNQFKVYKMQQFENWNVTRLTNQRFPKMNETNDYLDMNYFGMNCFENKTQLEKCAFPSKSCLESPKKASAVSKYFLQGKSSRKKRIFLSTFTIARNVADAYHKGKTLVRAIHL